MVWTNLDRPQNKAAITTQYLNGLRNNAKHLSDLFFATHDVNGRHTIHNDSQSAGWAPYPVALYFVKYDVDADNYTIEKLRLGSPATAPGISSSGVGKLTITMGMGSGPSTINDYAVLCSPISTPNEGALLTNRCATVHQSSTTAFDVSLFEVPNSTAEVTANAVTMVDSSFVCALYHTDTTLINQHSFSNMPELPEGAPVTSEWIGRLYLNIYSLQIPLAIWHHSGSGNHIRAYGVPDAAGVATYKKALNSEDNGSWVLETWTDGVAENGLSELNSNFTDEVQDKDEQLKMLGIALGQPLTSSLAYATLCTMNVYSHRADYARTVHPFQYRDNTVFAPRYWDDVITSGGAWRWNIVDDAGDGAPEAIAMIRWNKPGTFNSLSRSNRASYMYDATYPAAGDLLSITNLTELQETMEEMKAVIEYQHDKTDGQHDVQPPGIIGYGRVVYSGSAWNLMSWGAGIDGVQSTASIGLSTFGCRMTFTSAFASFRNWGMIVTPESDRSIAAQSAGNYQMPVVVKDNGAYADVYVHTATASWNPAPRNARFNFILIGIK